MINSRRKAHLPGGFFPVTNQTYMECSQNDGAMKTTFLVTLLSGLFLVASANAEEKT